MNSPRLAFFLGPGGVGKTSLSASFAAYQAQKGLKTLVMTIDPALRLKQLWTLNESLNPQKLGPQLWGLILDHQKAFELFLQNRLPPSWQAKIKQNRLYRLITGPLGTLQEFSFLDRLYDFYHSGQWDAIVIDTAPHVHGLGFLQAPRDLMNLFHPKVVKLLSLGEKKPLFQWFQSQWSPFRLILEKLVGKDFYQDLSQFLLSAHKIHPALQERLKFLEKLWTHSTTQIFIVTQPDESKILEAKKIQQQLLHWGIGKWVFIVNRSYPAWLWPEDPPFPHPLEPKNVILPHWWRQCRDQIQQIRNALSPQPTLFIPQWHWQQAPDPQDKVWSAIWSSLTSP